MLSRYSRRTLVYFKKHIFVAMNKYLRIISLLICFNEIYCLPVAINPVFVPISVLQPNTYSTNDQFNNNRPKQVWNVIGNLIQSSGFLPIEINVPDTIGAIYNGAQNVYNGISMGISNVAGNVVQRIPILQQLTSANNPRPLKQPMILLVPYEMMAAENSGNQFSSNGNIPIIQ